MGKKVVSPHGRLAEREPRKQKREKKKYKTFLYIIPLLAPYLSLAKKYQNTVVKICLLLVQTSHHAFPTPFFC